MNQLKRWVSEHNGDGARASSRPNLNLRTSNSYDCDERFSIVALNMLSRLEYFGMKPEDAIRETLVTSRDRSAFYEALSLRKMFGHQPEHHLSPSTLNLVQTLDCSFGRDLARMVERENPTPCGSTENDCNQANAMNTATTPHRGQWHQQQQQNPMFQPHPCVKQQMKNVRGSHSRCKGSSSSKGRAPRAFFFPDNGFFGVTSSKVTTRNIDWKLAEAIEQVSSLRLDGMATSPTATESMFGSSASCDIYEPPHLAAGGQNQAWTNDQNSNQMYMG
eukprot:CAMPEP_0168748920 /NCGR_PEP_ID=MMETSP0724-20121128/16431_1 /TAXON_ID=265536 /ORGANISM="Amphiprora sp., Strain CCMP467" /LENGTH=275 /DNA_ID=CAMNT_0008796777 /DNA_START=48 /DNA_END=875 /DNA_ORIENTATION=-